MTTRSHIKKFTDATGDEVAVLVPFLAAIKRAANGIGVGKLEELAAGHSVSPELLRRSLFLYCRRDSRYWLTGIGSGFLTAATQRAVPGSHGLPTRVPVEVLPHAIDRARQRGLLPGMNREDLRKAIVADVRRGFAQGRASRDKPPWLRLTTPRHGSGRKSALPRLFHPENQFYVWDEEKTRAWVVLKSPDRWTVSTGLPR